MARRLLYTGDVIRRRLSLQLALVMLLVALVPLAGAGLLILNLIEGSITDQVRASQEQLATAAGALVRDHLKSATTKLKSISAMIRKDEDPQEQTRRLNALLDPPDLFLEITYWTVGNKQVEVQAQAQQLEYNLAQTANKPSSRNYNSKVKQQVPSWSNDSPILQQAASGKIFIAETNDNVGSFNGLPISVPATGGAALTATLDLNPVSQMLASVAGSPERQVVLRDHAGKTLAASATGALQPASITTRHPVGHGGWVIDVTEPRELALAPLRQARDQALIWFGLAFVMAVGLAFLFAGRVVRPVRSLAGTADALGHGDFAARSGITREDEIGQLAQAFDRMAAAVQQIDQVKGEFVAHVSHELRTPLTSAKVTLANLQEGIGGKESLGRVQEDLDRLIRMVNELLDVARLDAGIALAKERSDLGALVRGAVQTLRPLARIPLSVSGAGDTLDLDAARVHQIVLNLVDNALKYAKSRVDVLVRGREVRVSDDGPGVPPEHRERIFEKFAKVETGPKPPGAGLGLSIARKLAQLHGGSLVCEGNTFVLRF
jgi:signal transduction histidine kinase